MTKYIDRIGIELEGGWSKIFDDVVIGEDVSVRRPGNISAETGHWGEVNSEPLELEAAIAWLHAHMPEGIYDDGHHTCGLHVHVSVLRNLDYARLATRSFYDYFLKVAEEWGKREKIPEDDPFWARLAGKNRFCLRKFDAAKQMELIRKEDVRRTIINFPYKLHRTVEFRLFPMWLDASRCESAVRMAVSSIETWLPTQKAERALASVIKVKEPPGPSVRKELLRRNLEL